MSRAHRRGARLALAALLAATAAGAQQIDIDCDRLSQTEAEELRARARLTLGTRLAPDVPGVIEFRCRQSRAWWAWSGDEPGAVSVDDRLGLVEGALDALERSVLRRSNEQVPPRALPSEEDVDLQLHEAAPMPAQREPPRPEPGGLGASVSAEPRSGTVALGPGFELGVGSGDWVGVVSESVRWESQDSTLLWDARLGVGWGAPFVPHRRLGLIAGVGLQGLSVVGRDPGPRGDANGLAPLAALGLRGSLRWSRTVLWMGLDGGYRLQPLEVGAPFDLSLPRTFLTLTVGVLMLADSGDGRPAPRETSRTRSDIAIIRCAVDRTRVSGSAAFSEPVCTRIQQ